MPMPQFNNMGERKQQLKWISVKWASQKMFAKFFKENDNKWDNDKFFLVKRLKKGYFEFLCKHCGHTWSTHYGTFKFYIAFKKDKNGVLMEDEIYVRVIAYQLDCINCKAYADSG